jgi:hypothetical protein
LLSHLLAKTFAELGATGPVVRTVLLHDRHFVGQTFRCEEFQAVVLAGKDEIEFHDGAGVLVRTVRLESTQQQKAV